MNSCHQHTAGAVPLVLSTGALWESELSTGSVSIDDSATLSVPFWMCSQMNASCRKVTTMSTTTIHGPKVSLDAFGRCAVAAGSPDDAARSRLMDAVRCASGGGLEKAIERAEGVYDDQEVSIELRLEAAKLRIDWYAAQGSYDRCRRVAGDAARLGAAALERDHPLVLMLRNSEAYWLSILGFNDMAARRFCALVADVKACPGLDPQIAFAIRNNSAMPWKNTGKWNRAARVYRELLADMEGARDEADMTLLTVRDNLAEVLSADRHYDEAIALYEHNMDVLLTVVERGDWRVLRLRNEIARNTWMGGDRDAGEDLWTVLAEDCRRYLGDRDPLTARIRTILLTLATMRGDDERAERIARKLRDDHPDDWEDCDFTEALAIVAQSEMGGGDAV